MSTAEIVRRVTVTTVTGVSGMRQATVGQRTYYWCDQCHVAGDEIGVYGGRFLCNSCAVEGC